MKKRKLKRFESGRFYFLEPNNLSTIFQDTLNRLLGEHDNNIFKNTPDIYSHPADYYFKKIDLYNL